MNQINDAEPILSEDPWVCITRGQRPTILDPFALARLGHTRPEAVQHLIGRIGAKNFNTSSCCSVSTTAIRMIAMPGKCAISAPQSWQPCGHITSWNQRRRAISSTVLAMRG